MQRRTSTGFTLIELIATMILIGILGVTVLPRFIGSSSFSAYSVRSELISALRQLQQRAINNTDRCYRMQFSAQGYQTQKSIDCNGIFTSLSALHSWADDTTVSLNNQQTFTISFTSQGNTNQSDQIITVTADDSVDILINTEGYIRAQ